MAKGILIKNGGGISLPTLTNEATSDELLVGKELINSEGKVLVGTGDLIELNFQVVGETTQPASPKENTIWVETDAEITGWAFSAKEPADPIEGMVWIKTGFASTHSFNALRKNAITIYPAAASQYLSGEWVRKEPKIFINESWDVFALVVFDNGNMGVSEGFDFRTSDGVKSGSITIGNEITFVVNKWGAGAYVGAMSTTNAIDVTPFSTARFDVKYAAKGYYDYNNKVGVSTSMCDYSDGSFVVASGYGLQRQVIDVDISEMTGPCYPTVVTMGATTSAGNTATVYSITIF